MTAKLDVELCTPVDLVAPPSRQYVKIDEVMDICARLGVQLALESVDRVGTRNIIINALRLLVEHGAPLERIMLYEIASGMGEPYSLHSERNETVEEASSGP